MVAPLVAAAVSLLPLVLKLAPELARWAGGEKAEDIAVKGAEIIKTITGTTDPVAAEIILNDPLKTVDARIALAKIAADQQAAEQQAKLDTLRAELTDVASARAQTVALAQTDSKIAWAAPIISVVIVAGFFGAPAMYAWALREPDQIWLGALIAGFGAVYQYWLGASRSGQQAQQAVERVTANTVNAANKAAAVAVERAAVVAAAEAAKPQQTPQVVLIPPVPAAVQTPQAPSETDWKQGPYGGARWRLLPEGVHVEGDAGVARTVGEPVTVRKAWSLYGELMKTECIKRGVPVEIGMAILCTESGRNLNPSATLVEPDQRVSSGIMQVLTATASQMLGRKVDVNELKNPQTSISAGVAYLQHQKDKTWFDPILSAAAYNAGGLHQARPQDNNRFNLRSTGDHLERMIRWYGDICFVAKEDGWFKEAQK